MKALKDRKIEVKKGDNGLFIATTVINGTLGVQLLAVHVVLSKGMIPSVKYVEIHGKDDDGNSVYEKKMG